MTDQVCGYCGKVHWPPCEYNQEEAQCSGGY